MFKVIHLKRRIEIIRSYNLPFSFYYHLLFSYTVELKWLEHLKDYGNMLEIEVVRANES